MDTSRKYWRPWTNYEHTKLLKKPTSYFFEPSSTDTVSDTLNSSRQSKKKNICVSCLRKGSEEIPIEPWHTDQNRSPNFHLHYSQYDLTPYPLTPTQKNQERGDGTTKTFETQGTTYRSFTMTGPRDSVTNLLSKRQHNDLGDIWKILVLNLP